MKRNFTLAVMVILLVTLFAACVAPVQVPAGEAAPAAGEAATGEAAAESAESVTVTHAQGETTLAKNPAKVFVFDYSTLDSLDKLGIPVAGVVKGTLPPYLAKYAGDEYADIGTLFEPNFELINQLQPDVIFVATRSATQLPALSEIAPTVDQTVDATDLVNSFKAAQERLGVIFGKEAEVAAEIAAIEETVARIQAAAAESGERALIVMTTGGGVTAHGPGSRFAIVHDILGVAPAAEQVAIDAHGDAISYEFILESNPEIIYVVDRDGAIDPANAAAKEIMDNELVNQTTAAQNGDIYYVDSAAWYLAGVGLESLAQVLADVEQAFAE